MLTLNHRNRLSTLTSTRSRVAGTDISSRPDVRARASGTPAAIVIRTSAVAGKFSASKTSPAPSAIGWARSFKNAASPVMRSLPVMVVLFSFNCRYCASPGTTMNARTPLRSSTRSSFANSFCGTARKTRLNSRTRTLSSETTASKLRRPLIFIGGPPTVSVASMLSLLPTARRSAAGSCTLMPPTTLTNTSSWANEMPARFSSTASSSAVRAKSR